MGRNILTIVATIAMVAGIAACAGKDGATGPMGPAGPAGPTGPTGPTGPAGPGTITNYFGSVTIVGTSGYVDYLCPALTTGSQVECYVVSTNGNQTALPLTMTEADSSVTTMTFSIFRSTKIVRFIWHNDHGTAISFGPSINQVFISIIN